MYKLTDLYKQLKEEETMKYKKLEQQLQTIKVELTFANQI